MIIGILGLQGCCLPHRQKFAALGVESLRIVYPADLDRVDGLVLPGGESTTMLKTGSAALWSALQDFAARRPVWGVCAGCILLAREVSHPAQPSLGIFPMQVARNAYGSQIDSFITQLAIATDPPAAMEGIFIRAPRILAVDPASRVLAVCQGDPVMVEHGRHLVTTFHPELAESNLIHEYFLGSVRAAAAS